jgi:hypothetical protein
MATRGLDESLFDTRFSLMFRVAIAIARIYTLRRAQLSSNQVD